MSTKILSAMTIFFMLTFSSCSTPPTKQDIGLVSGGVIGGAIGSLFGGGSGKVVAAGIGAVGGAFLGSEIGKSMDKQDQQKTTTSMNSPKSTSWKNPKTGNQYTIEPDKMYAANDTTCRHFTATGIIDGKSEKTTGTACLQPEQDAKWNVG